MKKTKFTKEKLRDVLLVSCLALLLVFAVWKIFYTPSSASRFSAGNAGEDENGVLSVAVVCDGAKNILVNSNIREAVSAALGVDEKNVKIYPKSR